MSSTSVTVEFSKEVKFENKDRNKEGENEEDEEEKEKEKDDEEGNGEFNGVDEGEIEEENGKGKLKITKKKRCQRRKKISQVCYDDEKWEMGTNVSLFYTEEDGEYDEEYLKEEDGEDEDEEEEGEEEDESEQSIDFSLLSAITFEWENETYEFDELCIPGNIQTLYKRYYSESELGDEIGVLRYLHACDLLFITPSIRLLRWFETSEIDLSFCNISSKNLRAMCYALETNAFVEKFILRYNKLSPKDCFHIGRMLRYNEKISHVDFTGCKIGPRGAENLVENLSKNDTVTYLNLSKCNLQDEGMFALSQFIMRNNSIEQLDLSYNQLEDGAAECIAIALKLNTKITDLNLRYNNLLNVQALKELFRSLILNPSITNLNLSWNGMSGKETANYIGNYLKKNSSVTNLDVSDNRFEGSTLGEIKKGLARSKSLVTLKIGNNPLSADSLDILLAGVKNCSTLKVLDLQNLWVNMSFVKALKKIQQDREINVNFEGVFGNYEIHGPDYPKLLFQRAQYEAMKPKNLKKRKDFGHLILSLEDEPMTEEEFMAKVKKFRAKVHKELYPELIKEFFDPKLKVIDVEAMKKKYLSIFPNSEPPPPPKEKKKKGRKGNEKKKEEKPTVLKVDEKLSKVHVPTKIKKDEDTEIDFIEDTEYEEEEEVEGEYEDEEEEGEIFFDEESENEEEETVEE